MNWSMKIFNNFCFLAAWLLVGESKLISKPENRKVWVDKTVRLECCTDLDDPIIWFFAPVGLTKPREIFNGENIIGSGSNYAVDTTTARCYTLVIATVASHHAGKYECQDNDGFGEKTSAELTVLDSRIQCDTLDRTSCSMMVSVHGNTEPTSNHCSRRETSSDTTQLEFSCHVCFSTGVSDEDTTFDLCLSRNITTDVPHYNEDDHVSPSVGKSTVPTSDLSQGSSTDSPTKTGTLPPSVATNSKDILVIVLAILLGLSGTVLFVVCLVHNKRLRKKLGSCKLKNDGSADENEKQILSSSTNQV